MAVKSEGESSSSDPLARRARVLPLMGDQSCIRMVRADYCGDGRPHTKDGTKINIWDRDGIQKPDAEQPGHPELFEAAWGPSGAVFLGIPRWSDDVGAVVAECPQKKSPGPRSSAATTKPSCSTAAT